MSNIFLLIELFHFNILVYRSSMDTYILKLSFNFAQVTSFRVFSVIFLKLLTETIMLSYLFLTFQSECLWPLFFMLLHWVGPVVIYRKEVLRSYTISRYKFISPFNPMSAEAVLSCINVYLLITIFIIFGNILRSEICFALYQYTYFNFILVHVNIIQVP